ncbi:MAG: nucleotidyltransferase domain-containing protein [Kiritimatiellia bacterium]|jgi:predicted nucleotidyltransferase|nr:nucleotidyltransferase domain-containing protein [Kiritimatiellia bacterium]
MISKADKSRIVDLGKQFRATRIVLFGSSTQSDRESRDIDIAVEGVPDRLFFKFYGALIAALSKPVDLVDLGRESPFTRLIARDGVALYG